MTDARPTPRNRPIPTTAKPRHATTNPVKWPYKDWTRDDNDNLLSGSSLMPPTAPQKPVQTFGKPRLQFIDPWTGKPSTGGKDVPEMNVLYLGKFVGTLRGSGCNYKFTETYPGTHEYGHFINYLRTHLLRYFDDKYARLGMDFETRLGALVDGTSS